MSTLLFLLFNCAVAFVAYWSKQNDQIGDGPTTGLLAMRNSSDRQRLAASTAVKLKKKRIALLNPSMAFRGKRGK